MDVKGKARIRRDWGAIFSEFEHSGLTVKEFCRRQAIASSLFYRHRRQLVVAEEPEQSVLGSSGFLELTGISRSHRPINISVGDGIMLSIGNDCDPDLLGRIISQLKS